MLLKLLMAAALMYGAVVAAVYLAQTQLLFPVGLARAGGPPLPSAERLEILSTSGHSLRGLHIPPAAPQPERLIILGFGGNAWNADTAAMYLHELYPAADIITFNYRGYPPSQGRPSTSAHIADAPLVYDFIRGRFGDVPIVAVGFSIGSGIVASRRPLTGAILVTPFDSLAAVASENYPWLPIRLLLRHRLDAAADLREVRIPIAIIAAGNDRLIPLRRTKALQAVVPRLVFDRTIAGADHNDIYRDPLFQETMREVLARVLSSTGSGKMR
jgi:fermentation-respiration switch protein FrsA (DUF1100 family)